MPGPFFFFGDVPAELKAESAGAESAGAVVWHYDEDYDRISRPSG